MRIDIEKENFSLRSAAFLSFWTASASLPRIKSPIPAAREAFQPVLAVFASICSLKVIILASLEWTNSESFLISSKDGKSSANKSIPHSCVTHPIGLLL